MIEILETKPVWEVCGVKYADVLARYYDGKEIWQTMKDSSVKFIKWLWSVRGSLTDEEIAELEEIIHQMRLDAINEVDED